MAGSDRRLYMVSGNEKDKICLGRVYDGALCFQPSNAGIRHAAPYYIAALLLSGLSVWRHRANIRRIQNGTEIKAG